MTVDSTTAKLFDTAQANHGVLLPVTDRLGGPGVRRDLANEGLLAAQERAAPGRAAQERAVQAWVPVLVLEAGPVVQIAMCQEDTLRAADPEA